MYQQDNAAKQVEPHVAASFDIISILSNFPSDAQNEIMNLVTQRIVETRREKIDQLRAQLEIETTLLSQINGTTPLAPIR